MRKIIFISAHYPGVVSVGRHGAGAGLWEFKHLADLDSNKEIKGNVIFGAYHPNYEKIKVKGKKGYYWTSCLFEMEQTRGLEFSQLTRILQLLEERKIDFVLFGDKSLAAIYRKKNTFYTPYPIDTSIKAKKKEKINGISLFAPIKFSKNLAAQIGAVCLLQKEKPLKLYTNIASYEPLLKLFNIDYELTGSPGFRWLPQKEYWELLSKMKINLSCTIAETFSYQVLEASLLGTPSVISPAVKSMDIQDLVVENPNSPIEIKEKIKETLNFPAFESRVRQRAIEIAEKNNKEAKKAIEKLK